MHIRPGPLLLTTIILLSILLFIPDCTPNQADDTSEQDGTPEPEENPKLDPSLNQLAQAYRWGEVEEFAYRNCIDLLYDDAGLLSVEVEIDCVPGQVEAAITAAKTYGTVEGSYLYMIVAVVPVTSLAALADEESVEFVRIPEYAEGAE
jgi:hypothetical protein